MVLQAIVMRLFPSQFENRVVKVGVSGGMTRAAMPEICEISLSIVLEPALTITPQLRYIRFLRLMFGVRGSHCCLGNIAIEARSAVAGEEVVAESDLPPIEDGSVLRFSRAVEIFIQSKRTLADAIELEEAKINLSIPDVYRQLITMSDGVNP
jgi:hypothetical protein